MKREPSGYPRLRSPTLLKYISPKINIIARLEFELAYSDLAVQLFSHYTTEIPPTLKWLGFGDPFGSQNFRDFMRLVFLDRFWFVLIAFFSVVKCMSFTIPSRILSHPVMPSLVFLLCQFSALVSYYYHHYYC